MTRSRTDNLSSGPTDRSSDGNHTMRFSATQTCLVIGIVLGFGLVFGGFDGLVVIAVFAALGLIVGRVLDGKLDLTEYLGGRRRDDR